jgi:hypothetical protein
MAHTLHSSTLNNGLTQTISIDDNGTITILLSAPANSLARVQKARVVKSIRFVGHEADMFVRCMRVAKEMKPNIVAEDKWARLDRCYRDDETCLSFGQSCNGEMFSVTHFVSKDGDKKVFYLPRITRDVLLDTVDQYIETLNTPTSDCARS